MFGFVAVGRKGVMKREFLEGHGLGILFFRRARCLRAEPDEGFNEGAWPVAGGF